MKKKGTMGNKLLLLIIGMGMLLPALQAQNVTTFTTYLDRFYVFDSGSFSELSSRKPREVVRAGNRVAFKDDRGDLQLYSDGSINRLDRTPDLQLIGSDFLLAFRIGRALKLMNGTRPTPLCYNTAAAIVQDSLIAFYDDAQHLLSVYWNGRSIPLADALLNTGHLSWTMGTNTLAFPGGNTDEMVYFYRGQMAVLCEYTDQTQVKAGGDILAFVDGYDRAFRVMDKGQFFDLESFAPLSFEVGDGIMAYVDAAGNFRCFQDGIIYDLLSQPPTSYNITDSVLTFIDQGRLQTFYRGRAVDIERYIPERWDISGGSIAYLDADRRIMVFQNGKSTAVSNRSGLTDYDHYRGVILFRENPNSVKVWWKGKVYEYY